MTTDEILAKVNSGELSGDALKEAVSALDVEQVVEIKKKISESATEEYGKVSAFRQEKQRLEGLVNQKKTELESISNPPAPTATPDTPAATDDSMKQFREEQKQKALNRLKSEYSLNDDTFNKVVENFTKFDSGKIDADHIFDELKGVYAFLNSDTLLATAQEKTQREAEAAAQAAQLAGGAQGAPNNGNQPPKYQPEVTQLAKQAGISEEAANKFATQGTKRVYQ